MSVSHPPGREPDASVPSLARWDLRSAWTGVLLVPAGFAVYGRRIGALVVFYWVFVAVAGFAGLT
jgi:hypothetical protein